MLDDAGFRRQEHEPPVPAGDVPPPVFQPHSVTVLDRPEGYRELRCIPATWLYSGERPVAALLTEFCSSLMGTDPYGTGIESEFWSGSDAALRLRSLPPDDLALRELAALASRRLLGLNARRVRKFGRADLQGNREPAASSFFGPRLHGGGQWRRFERVHDPSP